MIVLHYNTFLIHLPPIQYTIFFKEHIYLLLYEYLQNSINIHIIDMKGADRLKQHHLGALLVLASAAGFATLAIFIKMAYAAGANLLTVLTIRFLLASLFLWIILKPLGISPQVTKKTAGQLFLMGTIGYGSMSFLFAAALQYLPASLAEMLLFTYPVIVSILSFVIGIESFSWLKGLALLICSGGLFLILGVSLGNINQLGIFLGISGAIIYSCYILVSNRVLKDIHPLVATTYVCSAAALTFLAYAGTTNQLILTISLSGWLALLGIAIFGTIVGILCFFAGISKIGATNASIISTAEPIITVLLSAVVLGEQLSFLQICGGFLIIASILILQLCAANKTNEKITDSNMEIKTTSY